MHGVSLRHKHARTWPFDAAGTAAALARLEQHANEQVARLALIVNNVIDEVREARAQARGVRRRSAAAEPNAGGQLHDLTVCFTCGDGGLAGRLAGLGVGQSNTMTSACFLAVNRHDSRTLVTEKLEHAVKLGCPVVSTTDLATAMHSDRGAARRVRKLISDGKALSADIKCS